MKRLRVPDKHGVELAEYTREIVYCLGVGEEWREGGRSHARMFVATVWLWRWARDRLVLQGWREGLLCFTNVKREHGRWSQRLEAHSKTSVKYMQRRMRSPTDAIAGDVKLRGSWKLFSSLPFSNSLCSLRQYDAIDKYVQLVSTIFFPLPLVTNFDDSVKSKDIFWELYVQKSHRIVKIENPKIEQEIRNVYKMQRILYPSFLLIFERVQKYVALFRAEISISD